MSIFAFRDDTDFEESGFSICLRDLDFRTGPPGAKAEPSGMWHLWSDNLDRVFRRYLKDGLTCQASLIIRTAGDDLSGAERFCPALALEFYKPFYHNDRADLARVGKTMTSFYYDEQDYRYVTRLAWQVAPDRTYVDYGAHCRHIIKKAVERTIFGDYIFEDGETDLLDRTVEKLYAMRADFQMDRFIGDTKYQQDKIRHYLYIASVRALADSI